MLAPRYLAQWKHVYDINWHQHCSVINDNGTCSYWNHPQQCSLVLLALTSLYNQVPELSFNEESPGSAWPLKANRSVVAGACPYFGLHNRLWWFGSCYFSALWRGRFCTNTRCWLQAMFTSPEKTAPSLIWVAFCGASTCSVFVKFSVSSSQVSERCGAATALPGQWCSWHPAPPGCPLLGQILVAN